MAYCLIDKICVSHGGGHYAVTESGLTGRSLGQEADFLILDANKTFICHGGHEYSLLMIKLFNN